MTALEQGGSPSLSFWQLSQWYTHQLDDLVYGDSSR